MVEWGGIGPGQRLVVGVRPKSESTRHWELRHSARTIGSAEELVQDTFKLREKKE